MGWEYHNRNRDERGRFERTDKADRLQIRCTAQQYEHIRGRAYARQKSISEYVLDLIRVDMLWHCLETVKPLSDKPLYAYGRIWEAPDPAKVNPLYAYGRIWGQIGDSSPATVYAYGNTAGQATLEPDPAEEPQSIVYD